MKQSPDEQRLEELLRSRKIVAGGLMGNDQRSPQEIVETDLAELRRAGYSVAQLALRMKDITAKARKGLGTWVSVGGGLEAVSLDVRGVLVCPWQHPGRYGKTVTTVRSSSTGESVRWSALSLHLIEEHGFFEGKGSAFRVEPQELIDVLFAD